MSWLTIFADLRGVRRELSRIADALERAYPVPEKIKLSPVGADDISYASDEATARAEVMDELRAKGIEFDNEGNLVDTEEES